VGKICDFQPIGLRRWMSETGDTLWWVRVKHNRYRAPVVWRLLTTGLDLVLLGFQTCTAVARSPLRYQGFLSSNLTRRMRLCISD